MTLSGKSSNMDELGLNAEQMEMEIETSSGCLSDVSQSIATEEPFEITREQHLINVAPIRSSKLFNSTCTGNNVGKGRFTKILGSRAFNKSNDGVKSTRKSPLCNGNDENCDGNRSLNSAANHTIGSFETVKVSNAVKLDHHKKYVPIYRNEEYKSRWNPLKRMIRVKTTPLHSGYLSDALQFRFASEPIRENTDNNRQRAQTEDSRNTFLHVQRVQSTPDKRVPCTDRHSNCDFLNRVDQDEIDDNIRRRLYGVDVLYLGDGRYTTSVATSAAPWDTPFLHTFTGQTPHWSPQQIVDEMLLSSSGRDPPEILLDGITPGPDGRWTIQIGVPRQNLLLRKGTLKKVESTSGIGKGSDNLPSSYNTSHDNYNSTTSSTQLQRVIWGSEVPLLLHLTDYGNQSDEDNIHALAARLSIPIDIDDDSFLITSRDHVHALHDIMGISLAKGQFEDTCQIFNFLFRGTSSITDPDLRFFRGAALHNLGMVQLWQVSQRRNAAITFQKAIRERQKLLPPKHPDIIASLVRKATASFATGDLKGTISDLENALNMTSPDHFLRAKVVNNLGVAYYFHRGGKPALKEFIKSLEIQRRLLELTLRRDATVYDAAITLCNMGKVYLELSEFDLSFCAYEEALLMLTSIFSKDHEMVLACLSSLAIAKSQKGNISHALQILHGCLRSQNSRFGEWSPASIETVGLIGYLHAKNGELHAAIKYLSTVRKWQKVNLNAQHPSLLKTKESIRMLESRLGIIRSPSVAKVWV
jgi:tetratricopeptide (TPR) repeat protein